VIEADDQATQLVPLAISKLLSVTTPTTPTSTTTEVKVSYIPRLIGDLS